MTAALNHDATLDAVLHPHPHVYRACPRHWRVQVGGLTHETATWEAAILLAAHLIARRN